MNIKINNIAECHYGKDEQVVQGGLSTTPRQMEELTSRGEVVSSATVQMIDSGTFNPSWEIQPEFKRGIDIADVWNTSQEAKRKFRHAEILNNEPKTE